MKNMKQIMTAAKEKGMVIPAFNIPYLPMMEPTVQALIDTATFGLIEVARLEWTKFEAKSLEAVYAKYQKQKDERYTRLHLDHTPVIDEDGLTVDYAEIISRAIDVGYDSVMVDGSRLSLEENIKATKRVAEIAHNTDIAVEGELGAVLGHEDGPLPPYEELFASGKGFTDPEEARRFVEETGVDWLSVAIGNIHGAISPAARKEKKIAAKLNIEHLAKINHTIGIPLVLHGGSGIPNTYIQQAIKNGITKINIGTVIRKPYEGLKESSISKAQEAVYNTMIELIDELEIKGSADIINPD
jgi:ketose-bisphosphate aldolase